MHENPRGRVALLVNLMIRRLDKSDGPMFGAGGQGWGTYIYGGGLYLKCYIWGLYLKLGFG